MPSESNQVTKRYFTGLLPYYNAYNDTCTKVQNIHRIILESALIIKDGRNIKRTAFWVYWARRGRDGGVWDALFDLAWNTPDGEHNKCFK